MKDHVAQLVTAAVAQLIQQNLLPAEAADAVVIERTRDKSHGDFACNIAMRFAKVAKRNPREIAVAVIDALPQDPILEKAEIAGPGFINFFVKDDAAFAIVDRVLSEKERYGRSSAGAAKKIQIEFVSANPTGPLHVGHGRGAAYGAVVANLLEAVGFDVTREYYVNDAGRQMDILAASVWLRYLEAAGAAFNFPSNGYKGVYIRDISASLHKQYGDAFVVNIDDVFADVPADEPAGGDKELHIDGLVNKAKTLLGDEKYEQVFNAGLDAILGDIREDLSDFGVNYQVWYSEKSLVKSGQVEKAIATLQQAGHLYEKEGALWFRSTTFGDEKDRVVCRENGQTTYFASDIAYHLDKFERFDKVIDVWGADHHGYVPRVKAAIQAMGNEPENLDVLLVQFAILYKGGERMQMSTRSGEFVTLRELREDVGNDAARFFYVMRKCEQHLDFDLDLAKSQSNENPVYYIQYAHARICTMFAKLSEKGFSYDESLGATSYDLLVEEQEKDLVTALAKYPEVIEQSARLYEPHQVAHYLRELSHALHSYYNAHKVLVDDDKLRNARMNLAIAVKYVIANGLALLGVSAPESM